MLSDFIFFEQFQATKLILILCGRIKTLIKCQYLTAISQFIFFDVTFLFEVLPFCGDSTVYPFINFI